MDNIKRITIWVFLLVGSAFLFYLWSKERIREIEEMSTVTEVYIPVVKNDMATTSNNLYYKYSSTTPFQILLERGLNRDEWSTSTLKISTSTIDDKDFEFIFPDSRSTLYTNCTYDIKLNLGESLKPNYFGVKLIDFGTQKDIFAKNSGLINSLTFKDSVFRWTVGDVWPGDYYLLIPMMDGLDIKIKSQRFRIEKGGVDIKC